MLQEPQTKRIDLPPYPRGWFAVGTTLELTVGDVKPVHYFGRELVLFRTAEGEATMFDAYCPHLGAHLGHGGTVDGENLVCPFHGWRFGRDGTCSGMPYGKRIPSAATTRSWPLLEQNGVIHAWFDPEGEDPEYEMKRFDDSNWTPMVSKRWDILGHSQEVCENSVDYSHFRFIHNSQMMRAVGEPKIDGPWFEVAVECDFEALEEGLRIEGPDLEGSSFVFGPGLVAANMRPKGSGLDTMQRLYVTPIDEERVELLGVVNIGKLEGDAQTEALVEAMVPEIFRQWEADVPIWENKRYRSKPALNEMDSAIPVFRRWYSQFYA